eukprot:2904322-Pleurochrysis_carterae.AAC.3
MITSLIYTLHTHTVGARSSRSRSGRVNTRIACAWLLCVTLRLGRATYRAIARVERVALPAIDLVELPGTRDTFGKGRESARLHFCRIGGETLASPLEHRGIGGRAVSSRYERSRRFLSLPSRELQARTCAAALLYLSALLAFAIFKSSSCRVRLTRLCEESTKSGDYHSQCASRLCLAAVSILTVVGDNCAISCTQGASEYGQLLWSASRRPLGDNRESKTLNCRSCHIFYAGMTITADLTKTPRFTVLGDLKVMGLYDAREGGHHRGLRCRLGTFESGSPLDAL